MKEKIRYFIAGILIGLSELLPGISGATLALMFGVYEKLIDFLRKFNNVNLILPLLIGMILSVFSFSSLIDFLYKNYTYIFNIFIALLMIGYGMYLAVNTYLKEFLKGKLDIRPEILPVVLGIGFYIGLYLSLSLIHI